MRSHNSSAVLSGATPFTIDAKVSNFIPIGDRSLIVPAGPPVPSSIAVAVAETSAANVLHQRANALARASLLIDVNSSLVTAASAPGSASMSGSSNACNRFSS